MALAPQHPLARAPWSAALVAPSHYGGGLRDRMWGPLAID